ncbi:hypothetical protein JHU04_003324 [Brenneria sp. 4F2]|nr:hypothetical protein [Brenneria bubanii]
MTTKNSKVDMMMIIIVTAFRRGGIFPILVDVIALSIRDNAGSIIRIYKNTNRETNGG